MNKIVFTGGGSAGHVTANLAIFPKLRQDGWHIEYIGSESGIERQIITEFGGIPYHPIATGKLRRYFDRQNFKDPFRVLRGVAQAYSLLKKLKPGVVFSKGGFVAVPVVIASWLHRIPVIIHESDMTPGLANKISIPFATKVCVTFPETLRHIPSKKAVHTGSPIREEVLRGNAETGMRICGFHSGKPVLLIMGGSLGSQKINESIRENLPALTERFQIAHICGKGNVDETYSGLNGYRQFEYLHKELADVMAMADLVVSRAGSNSIFEFLALKKPMLLIPLSRQASRGDQILNAESFEKMGYCRVLYEENLSRQTLLDAIGGLYEQRDRYIMQMNRSPLGDGADKVAELIREVAGRGG